MLDVQLTTGQRNKWVGLLAQKCSPLSLALSPFFPLPNLRSGQKYCFFLSAPILWEERQSCNTYYKTQFLEAGCRGMLMNNKEERKGNL